MELPLRDVKGDSQSAPIYPFTELSASILIDRFIIIDWNGRYIEPPQLTKFFYWRHWEGKKNFVNALREVELMNEKRKWKLKFNERTGK
jgi:hypothetical protein